MNPILRREFLARWRDKRSHLLLFSLALLLAIVSYRSYTSALYSPAYNFMTGRVITESVTTRSSRAGHTLFTTLAVGNVGLWFVLAPLLLATGVARERERGLLESLQLSPMRPASQITARVLSALSFLAVLQLMTLPIYFMAFTFGGVSEREIVNVWTIVAVSGFCGVGLGLMLSAQSPRPSGALFGAVAFLVVWSLLAFVASNYGVWLFWLGLGTVAPTINGALYYGHPLVMVWHLHNPTYGYLTASMGPARASAQDMFSWALLGWGVMGLLGLIKATRDVTRPLPPVGWAGRNTLIQKWKNRREARLRAQQERRARVSVEGALLADLPFDKLIRFKNPLLNREVKSRFRLRRASAWVWTGRTAIFLAGAGVWVLVCFSVFFDAPGRPGAVSMVFWAEWLLGTALIATFAASSFAREREAGTWEGVQLSLLTPGEITRTKWASPLVAFAVLSSPLWLFLFPLLPFGNWNGVPLRWMVLGALVVISSLSLVSALGSWISLRAKNTATATCWTIGILLAVLVGTPFADESLSISNRIGLWRYGLGGDWSSYNYNSPQNMAIYTRQTGRQVFYPWAGSNIRVTTAQAQQWAQYSSWFEQTDADLRQFKKQFFFWHPIYLLTELQDRGRTSYSSSARSWQLNDETIVAMALLHSAVAGIATLVFLMAVGARLPKRLE